MRIDETGLGVVVITRNEAAHIGACLESVAQIVSDFPETPVIVVDSDSDDDTVVVASRYPVTMYQYRAPLLTAAAGRRIGFEKIHARYVLFVDGDSCIESSWVKIAVELMNASPDVAVIDGLRQENFEGVSLDFRSAGTAPKEYSLGGNALYRSEVLRQVGGFNPFIVAWEEAELLGRIEAAGYRAIRTLEVMYTHHTVPQDTVQAFIRRRRRRMTEGLGQVFRVALGQGLFAYHARRFNRYLLMLGYLGCGAIFGIAGGLLSRPSFLLSWMAIGVLAFTWLCFRRQSIRSAMYIVVEWLVVAIDMVRSFLQRPQLPATFAPVIEKIESSSGACLEEKN